MLINLLSILHDKSLNFSLRSYSFVLQGKNAYFNNSQELFCSTGVDFLLFQTHCGRQSMRERLPSSYASILRLCHSVRDTWSRAESVATPIHAVRLRYDTKINWP